MTLEQQLHAGWTELIHTNWEQAKTELLQVEKWECEMHCQQARIDWATYGDHNSKFFHPVIKERRRRSRIQLKQEDGSYLMAITDIGYQAMEYFFDLFMASPYHIAEQLFSGIPQQVSESDNNSFYALPLNEEILHAIKSMNH